MSLLSGFAQGATKGTLDHWEGVREQVLQDAKNAFAEKLADKRMTFDAAENQKGREHQATMQDDSQAFTSGENAANRTHTKDLQANQQTFTSGENAANREHQGLLQQGSQAHQAELQDDNQIFQASQTERTISANKEEKNLDRQLQEKIATAKAQQLTQTQKQDLAKELAAAQVEASMGDEDPAEVYRKILNELNGNSQSTVTAESIRQQYRDGLISRDQAKEMLKAL